MFRKANFRLTVLFSIFFLLSFWVFSGGLYFWMKNSFGTSYIKQVKQTPAVMQLMQNEEGDLITDPVFRQNTTDSQLDQSSTAIVTAAGDVALERLRNTLLIINFALVVVIPIVAWSLTRRTLAPVQSIHGRQKQFVSDVAHELRTPLTIMSGELEVALRKDRTAYEYEKVLVSNKEETDRLINLVENLLFLAREDQGKQIIEFEKVEITDLIGSVIASLQAESTQKEITLHFKSDAELALVSGQPSMLRRLFLNIVHNAILYTPAGGNIWVSLSVNRQQTEVSVKDTGIGISTEDQKKIFNRFYRVDSSRSQTRGYGLGLAICKSIVNLHNGTLTVHSVLGQGSTFSVTLPTTKS